MARILNALFTLTIYLAATVAFAQQSGPTMLTFKNANNVVVRNLTWTEPTKNTDETPIEYALNYRLYIDDVPTITFPGTLNDAGQYEFPLADVGAITEAGLYTFELTAFEQGVDLEQEPERESARSNAIQIIAVVVTVPKEPADLSTE